MKKYHITKPDNVNRILKEGLKCGNDGYIYLFDYEGITDSLGRSYLVADHIAINQIFLQEYALLEVRGIKKEELEPDNVAEFTSKWQYRIKRDIPAKNVKFLMKKIV